MTDGVIVGIFEKLKAMTSLASLSGYKANYGDSCNKACSSINGNDQEFDLLNE